MTGILLACAKCGETMDEYVLGPTWYVFFCRACTPENLIYSLDHLKTRLEAPAMHSSTGPLVPQNKRPLMDGPVVQKGPGREETPRERDAKPNWSSASHTSTITGERAVDVRHPRFARPGRPRTCPECVVDASDLDRLIEGEG